MIPTSVIGATITVGNGNFDNYRELDLALLAAVSGDTIQLDNNNGTINSTMTSGNITIFDKDLFIDLAINGTTAGNASIRMNNTIQFGGISKSINFTKPDLKLDLWYDAGNPGAQVNATLVQFTGSTDLFNSTPYLGSTIIINATTFTGTALNITSNNNGIDLSQENMTFLFHIRGTALPHAVNISGNSNFIHFDSGNGGDIIASGIGINLIGKSNHLIMDSDNTFGTAGRLYIGAGATGNYIHDYIGHIGYPQFSIYNGTAYNETLKAGYFYNSTWSKSGKNMNVTVSVRNLPYGGNTSVKILYNNVTGTAGDMVLNSTLTVNSSAVFGGLIFNNTGLVDFIHTISEVPIKYTLGGNTLHINFPSSDYESEYNVGTVKIINFNPYHSITSMNMNETKTTNWTEISDFTSVNPLSFVVDNGSTDHRLLGNLTLTQGVNLIDAINQLDDLSTKMTITDRNITLDATSLSAFNMNATLTMYPTFSFSTSANLSLSVTPDGGAKTTLWNGTVWSSVWNTYLSSKIIDMNTSGAAKIYTNHFSKFELEPYTAPTPVPTTAPASSGSSSSGGGGTNDISTGVANSIKAGETAAFSVDNSAVYEVTATVKDDTQKMMITVEKKALPRGIEETELDTYEYDQIVLYWADDSDISKGTLEFKVSKDWLSKKGLTFGDIVMIRYNEETETWEELPTEYIGEESHNYKYRATTPGFSYFGIAASEGATMVSEEKSIKAVDVVVVKETTEVATPQETQAPAEPEQTPEATPIGLAPLFAVLISGMLLFLRRI